MSSSDSRLLLQRPYMAKKLPWYKDKMFYLNLLRRSLAEFLGTGLFVFTSVSALSGGGGGGSGGGGREGGWSDGSVPAGLAQGLGYGALVAAMMHVSGGHLNPAVTVGVLVAGGVNVVATVFYIIAQLTGGIVGAACVLAYDSNSSATSTVDYGVTQLQSQIGPVQGILVELLLTLMLVTVFIHTTMERTEFRPVAPVIIGLALTAAVVASYSLTGGSLNPARSLGPASVSSRPHRWTHHYVYWVGPLVGGAISGAFHRLILSSRPMIPIREPDTVHT